MDDLGVPLFLETPIYNDLFPAGKCHPKLVVIVREVSPEMTLIQVKDLW